MSELAVAVVNPNDASPAQIRDWSIAVRARIPEMSADELDQVEALLIALRKRLRQLGEDVAETERSRILAWQRKGDLLGPGEETQGQRSDLWVNPQRFSLTEQDERKRARLLAAYPGVVKQALEAKSPTLDKAVNMCKRQRAADQAADVAAQMAEHVDVSGDQSPKAQWWQLGRHLLYCGDSADPEFIDRVAGASFAFADFFGTTAMPYRWSIARCRMNTLDRIEAT